VIRKQWRDDECCFLCGGCPGRVSEWRLGSGAAISQSAAEGAARGAGRVDLVATAPSTDRATTCTCCRRLYSRRHVAFDELVSGGLNLAADSYNCNHARCRDRGGGARHLIMTMSSMSSSERSARAGHDVAANCDRRRKGKVRTSIEIAFCELRNVNCAIARPRKSELDSQMKRRGRVC